MNSPKSDFEINQGDIFWVNPNEPDRAGVNRAHPYVVLQDDILNRSRIDTVVVCALTSNRKRMNEPGNLLLEVGEANLEKHSIVIVSQVSVVKKSELGEYIGTLSSQRVDQVFSGMKFQQLAFFALR